MENFPKEINVEILKNISGEDILKLCGTSKKFANICSDDQKYNTLWKLKIKEEFGETYNGPLAFTQYKYLNKLHQQYFYLLYYSNDDDSEDLIAIYDTYDKVVISGIEEVQRSLGEMGQSASLESIKYLFLNTNNIRWNDYHNLRIDRRTLAKNLKIDERKFFTDREKLYVDLFGKSSEGASSHIENSFENNKNNDIRKSFRGIKSARIREKEIEIKRTTPFPVLFFKTLDNTIKTLNDRTLLKSSDIEREIKNFAEFGLDMKQKEILKKYISDNIFQPKDYSNNDDNDDDSNDDDSNDDDNNNDDNDDNDNNNNNNNGNYNNNTVFILPTITPK